jgi:protein-S-isoprenylcysteine O-methyltransferase Ste14
MIKIIILIGLAFIYIPRLRPSVLKRITEKKLSSLGFLLVEILILFIALYQLFNTEIIYNTLTYTGLVLFIFGVTLATVARYQLRKNYMPAFSARTPNNVVMNGAYKIVRNPIYLGMLLVVVGFELILYPILAAVGIITFIIFVVQIKKEEKLIGDSLGEDWTKFRKQTKYRLIPFVW